MQWEKELLNGPSHRKWFFCSRARERPFSKKKENHFFAFQQKNQRWKCNEPETAIKQQRIGSDFFIQTRVPVSSDFARIQRFLLLRWNSSWKVNVMENFLFTHEISLWIIAILKSFLALAQESTIFHHSCEQVSYGKWTCSK